MNEEENNEDEDEIEGIQNDQKMPKQRPTCLKRQVTKLTEALRLGMKDTSPVLIDGLNRGALIRSLVHARKMVGEVCCKHLVSVAMGGQMWAASRPPPSDHTWRD